jgi:hypothetical protein
MSPLAFLASTVALSLAAFLAHRVIRHRRRTLLRRMAAEWRMRYSAPDLFHITQRIAGGFPVADATDLRVLDVIYGTHGDRHRYVFTAEYNLGRVDRHKRTARAGTYCEPRDPARGGPPTPLTLAPSELELLEQYAWLHERHCATEIPAASATPPGSPPAAAGSSPDRSPRPT